MIMTKYDWVFYKTSNTLHSLFLNDGFHPCQLNFIHASQIILEILIPLLSALVVGYGCEVYTFLPYVRFGIFLIP